MQVNSEITGHDPSTIQPQVNEGTGGQAAPSSGSTGGAQTATNAPAVAIDAYEPAAGTDLFSASPARDGAADAARSRFAERFAGLAGDPDAFHQTMEQVYGSGYDRQAAESIRQRALSGDTSWMPEVEFVSAETLQGGRGAFDAEGGKIYLNEALRADPAAAAEVYAEEFGHFLDTELRSTDSAGDEGELFRRLLGGEQLSGADISAIRAENDHGTIEVAGRQVAVEFWGFGDIGSAIGSAASAVGNAVSSAASAVGSAVSSGASAIGNAVSSGASAVGNFVSNGASAVGNFVSNGASAVGNFVSNAASSVTNAVSSAASTVADTASAVVDKAKDVVGGIVDKAKDVAVDVGRGLYNAGATAVNTVVDAAVDFGGAVKDGYEEVKDHLSRGEIGDALRAGFRAFDRAVLQTPSRLFNGAVDTGFHLLDAGSRLLGPLGGPVREGGGRVLDAFRAVGNFGIGTVRDLVRAPVETAIGFGEGMWETGTHLVNGRFGDAARTFGSTFLNSAVRLGGTVVDIGARGLAAFANAGGTLVGYGSIDQPVSDLLSPQQLADLEATYGGSLDLDHVYVDRGGLVSFGGVAKVIGNTVYMPDGAFDANGQLTADGFHTFQHELGHVWQNQNGGGDYIHSALLSQAIGSVTTGNRNAAYDWRPSVASGVDFQELNPEQQGEVIQVLSELTAAGGVPDLGDSVLHRSNGRYENLTQAEVDFLNDALDDVRAGRN